MKYLYRQKITIVKKEYKYCGSIVMVYLWASLKFFQSRVVLGSEQFDHRRLSSANNIVRMQTPKKKG